MTFLKNNIFYVALVLATIVIGGLILVPTMSIGKQNDLSEQKRLSSISDVAALMRKPMVGQKVLGALALAVTSNQEDLREVAEFALLWNKRDFHVMMLAIFEGDRKIGEVPAFPMDHDKYQKSALRFHLTKEYYRQLAVLLQNLDAIGPPTQKEIDAAALRAADRLQRAARLEAERRAAMAPAEAPTKRRPDGLGGVPRGMPGREFDPEFEGRGVSRRGVRPVRGGRGGGEVNSFKGGEQATREGLGVAVMAKANTGPIYADIASLTPVLAPDERAEDTRLFAAQVGLWITGDILEAINLTVKDSLRTPDGKVLRATVPNSAVKRIVAVEIGDDFVVGAEGSGAKAAGAGAGAVRATGVKKKSKRGGGRPRPGRFDPEGYPGGEPGGYPGAGGGTGVRTGAAASSGGVTITQRVSNPRYDVKHYSFTLIMDSRYVPVLQKHLMARNFHTILASQIEMVPPGQAETENYYYGGSPVVKVTIKGELLLLTDWLRGTWVKADKRGDSGHWSEQLLPLMPKEVLKSISGRDKTALRAEDRTYAKIVAVQPARRMSRNR